MKQLPCTTLVLILMVCFVVVFRRLVVNIPSAVGISRGLITLLNCPSVAECIYICIYFFSLLSELLSCTFKESQEMSLFLIE